MAGVGLGRAQGLAGGQDGAAAEIVPGDEGGVRDVEVAQLVGDGMVAQFQAARSGAQASLVNGARGDGGPEQFALAHAVGDDGAVVLEGQAALLDGQGQDMGVTLGHAHPLVGGALLKVHVGHKFGVTPDDAAAVAGDEGGDGQVEDKEAPAGVARFQGDGEAGWRLLAVGAGEGDADLAVGTDAGVKVVKGRDGHGGPSARQGDGVQIGRRQQGAHALQVGAEKAHEAVVAIIVDRQVDPGRADVDILFAGAGPVEKVVVGARFEAQQGLEAGVAQGHAPGQQQRAGDEHLALASHGTCLLCFAVIAGQGSVFGTLAP